MNKKTISLLFVAVLVVVLSFWGSKKLSDHTASKEAEQTKWTLTGNVVDHFGEDIEDVLVVVRRNGSDGNGPETLAYKAAEVSTDAAGRYEVQIDRYTKAVDLHFSVPGKQSVDRRAIRLTRDVLDIGRIVMLEQIRIHGQVTDQTKYPLVGATILLHVASASSGQGSVETLYATTQSDELGKYELGPLEPGRYRISAGYAPYSPSASSDLQLNKDAGSFEQDLMFPELTVIKGRVVDSGSSGLEGVNVEIRDGLRRISRDLTRADGKFDLGAYPTGIELFIKAWKSGLSPVSERQLTATDRPVHIMMKRLGALHGRAADEVGHPVPELEITLVKRDGPTQSEVEWARYKNIRTDRQGVFEVDGVPAGLWDLQATADGFEPLMLKRIAIDEDVATEQIELEFVVGRTFRGRIVDGRSLLGIAGSRVEIYSHSRGENAPPLAVASTSEDGRFAIRDVTQEAVSIVASAPGYAANSVELEESGEAESLEIALQPSARVTGVIVTANGSTPIQGTVSLSNVATSSSRRRTTDENGRFQFEGLRAGTYVISANTDAGVVERRSISIGERPSDLNTELRLIVEPGADVSGRLFNLDSGSLSSARVFVNGHGGFADASAVDQDGRFSFLGVPEGEISVTVRLPKGLSLTKTLEVASHTAETVNFTFGQPGRLSGLIRSNGHPISGATVSAFPSSPNAPYGWAVSSANGEFLITGLAIDRYVVRINGGHDQSVNVGDSTVLNLDIAGSQSNPEPH